MAMINGRILGRTGYALPASPAHSLPFDDGPSSKDPVASRHRVTSSEREADARGPRIGQRYDRYRARHKGGSRARRHPRRRTAHQSTRTASVSPAEQAPRVYDDAIGSGKTGDGARPAERR